jgi:twitching motility protein PilT
MKLLQEAVVTGASDLHCCADELPALRISGAVRLLKDRPVLSNEELLEEFEKLLMPTLKTRLEGVDEFDCAIALADLGRFRVHLYRSASGISAAIRLVPRDVPRLDSLSLPNFVSKISQIEQGLVLVTGPTGSGKSTTLAAIIDQINRERACQIVTIEDPIEYQHSSIQSLIRHREVGKHTRSFGAALRSALREDPDVILVGELRDLETIQLALTAAETGHLILATLHASGATSSIERFVNAFPSDARSQARSSLADCLEVVVSQRLISGAQGMLKPDAEILIATPAVRALIREGKAHQLPGVIQSSRGVGMRLFGG